MTEFSLDKLLTLPQHLVPHHGLSRLIGGLATSELEPLKNFLIKNFIKIYNVNMDEALYPDPTSYRNFNEFFTRPLRANARPIDSDENTLVCPADGAVSQYGKIKSGRIFQAKGHSYSARELLGGDAKRAEPFLDGEFITVYLSPKDYHRVHMPLRGRLKEMIFVPGDLFSVNNRTAEQVDNLFARNERVVAMFETDLGPMALVLVGAMIVASIETKWHGTVAPSTQKRTVVTSYDENSFTLNRGEEMGRFKLGSTAIVLLPKDSITWENKVQACLGVRMGEKLAVCN